MATLEARDSGEENQVWGVPVQESSENREVRDDRAMAQQSEHACNQKLRLWAA